MRIAILGSGAIGGYYGGRLVQAGEEVHFLYRSELEVVRRQGLRIRSVDGNWQGPVEAYGDAGEMPPCDVAILGFKTAQIGLLPDLLPKVLAPDGVAVCLMNGLGNEEACAAVVGENRVLAGAAFICAERGAPGEVLHFAAGGLAFAPYFESGRDRLAVVADDLGSRFRSAGVPVRKARDGRKVKWGKLVWNVPFSGLSIALGGVTTDAIVTNSVHRARAVALMREVLLAARADGVELEERLPEDNLAQTDSMGAYRPSILVDFLAGRPTEHEAIVGEPVRRAEAAGIHVPAMRELYEEILGRCAT
jgi:2-dehydropantoate 2-reductase